MTENRDREVWFLFVPDIHRIPMVLNFCPFVFNMA
jgi:hypothetical protein